MRTTPIVFRLTPTEKTLLSDLAKDQGKSLSQTIRDLLELSLQDAAILKEVEGLKNLLSHTPDSPPLAAPAQEALLARLATLEQGVLRANVAIDELTRMVCRTEAPYREYQQTVAEKLRRLNHQHKEP